MQIRYTREFKRQYSKAPEKIKQAFKKRQRLFARGPHDLILNNHKLKGRLKGYGSINITGDWRVIYLARNGGVVFMVMGTHSQLCCIDR